MSRRIFIDNLGPTTKQEALEELFRGTGKVESMVIPPRHEYGNPGAHAFVLMASDKDATMAIHSLNNKDWNGFKLTVTHAGPTPTRRSGFAGGMNVGERKNRN